MRPGERALSPVTGHIEERLAGLVEARLAAEDASLAQMYPGASPDRQPVHTCYVPADVITVAMIGEWGQAALELLDTNAGTPDALAVVLGDALDATAVELGEVVPRVRAKLASRPVEDLRIDLEDGYGVRSDAEEDAAAAHAGRVIAGLVDLGPAAPIVAGVRIKSLWQATRGRALRSLDLVIGAAVAAGGLPPRFVVTLPKAASVAQVEAMVEVCGALEAGYGLRDGVIRLELQVEVPQAIVAADGSVPLARMIAAGAGRCEGLHYGTYDFSAAVGVGGRFQALDHPLADVAKAVMQFAAAGTGARVSDGATNVMPVGSREAVHAAWALHAALVRRQWERALYQGWDMHPGHLVTRYTAAYVMARRELPVAAGRLQAYLARAASETVDEPATARALALGVLRGLDCGAIDAAEVSAVLPVGREVLDDLAGRGSEARAS